MKICFLNIYLFEKGILGQVDPLWLLLPRCDLWLKKWFLEGRKPLGCHWYCYKSQILVVHIQRVKSK